MKKLLALDLATETGFAVGSPDGEPTYGSFRIFDVGIGAFLDAFETWLTKQVRDYQPGLVVFEAPILKKEGTQISTVRKLTSLAGITEMVCHRSETQVLEAHLQSVKKYFSGKGNATKEDMIQSAHRWGWPTDNHNQADALGIWAYTISEKKPSLIADRHLQAFMGGRAA